MAESERQAQNWKRQLSAQNYRSALIEALDEFLKEFEVVNQAYSITPYVAIEAWQHDFNETARSLISINKLNSQQDALISALCQPWKKTALIKMQDKLRNGESPENIVKEYQFLRSWSVIWHKPINSDWIQGSLAKHFSDTDLVKYTVKETIELLQPNNEQKKLLELAPIITFFKDWRDDLRRRHVYLWSFLWEIMATLLEIDRSDLGYLSIEEIKESLKKGYVEKKIISWRKENPLIVTWDGRDIKMKVIDKDIRDYQQIMKTVGSGSQDNIIKGLVAQSGKVIGRVHVVNSYEDIKNFEDGRVLVANTTHPNYLPAMQKAIAFVTNDGGIISHAAIVARELKKPCIVGTKNATKILKDGDLVEVDANKGIVNIIQNK